MYCASRGKPYDSWTAFCPHCGASAAPIVVSLGDSCSSGEGNEPFYSQDTQASENSGGNDVGFTDITTGAFLSSNVLDKAFLEKRLALTWTEYEENTEARIAECHEQVCT